MTFREKSELFMMRKMCFSESVLSLRSLKIMLENSLSVWLLPHSKFIFRRQVISLLSVSRENKICAYLALRDLCSQASRLNTAAQEQTTHITLCLHQWSKIWRKQYTYCTVQLHLHKPTSWTYIFSYICFNAKSIHTKQERPSLSDSQELKENDLLTPRHFFGSVTLKHTSTHIGSVTLKHNSTFIKGFSVTISFLITFFTAYTECQCLIQVLHAARWKRASPEGVK